MTTVCKWCASFKNVEPDSIRADVWYNHLCTVSPLPMSVDPYDGQEKPVGVNSLGHSYFSEDKFHYCRDVNDGHCQLFSALISEPQKIE